MFAEFNSIKCFYFYIIAFQLVTMTTVFVGGRTNINTNIGTDSGTNAL